MARSRSHPLAGRRHGYDQTGVELEQDEGTIVLGRQPGEKTGADDKAAEKPATKSKS